MLNFRVIIFLCIFSLYDYFSLYFSIKNFLIKIKNLNNAKIEKPIPKECVKYWDCCNYKEAVWLRPLFFDFVLCCFVFLTTSFNYYQKKNLHRLPRILVENDRNISFDAHWSFKMCISLSTVLIFTSISKTD